MMTHPLGSTGIRVSSIGFGAWGIGGTSDGAVAYGPTEDQTSLAALQRAFELGITYYDTSNLYGYGHSEKLLGQAFKDCRDKVVLGTKGGFLRFSGEQDFSVKHLQQALDGSLRRLGTDYIDLYQLHSPPPDHITDEVFSVLSDWKRAGKVRALGVSLKSPLEGRVVLDTFSFDVVQANFSLFDQRALDCELLAICESKNVGFIGRTPLCFGFLTGKYEAAAFPPGDHRAAWTAEQREEWIKAGRRLGEGTAAALGQSAAQLALRFCLSYPAVSTVIPGMLTVAEVEENAVAGKDGPLPKDLLSEYEAWSKNG